MKITVDRNNNEDGDLVFTITIREPALNPFTEEEKAFMSLLEACKVQASGFETNNLIIKNIVLADLNMTKERIFMQVLRRVRFSIKEELELKFHPMCIEIYNWIYDAQDGFLKQWMTEYDPQRTKYYFDNDKTIESDYDYEEEDREDEERFQDE